jgi:hypothetical protein
MHPGFKVRTIDRFCLPRDSVEELQPGEGTMSPTDAQQIGCLPLPVTREPPRAVSEADAVRWYKARVALLVSHGERSTREEDRKAAKDKFTSAKLTTDRLSDLRNKYAPAEWLRTGPWRKKSARKSSARKSAS